MTPPLDALLKVAREVVEHDKAMTPGPWKHAVVQHRDGENGDGDVVAEHAEVTDEDGMCLATIAHDLDGSEALDAAGIAHARTAAPQLAAFVLAIGPALEEWHAKRNDHLAGRCGARDEEAALDALSAAVAQARSVAP